MRVFRACCLGVAGVLALEVASVSLAVEPVRFQATQTHMGSSFRFTFYAKDEKTANQALQAVSERIELLEQSMSDYRNDSEVTLLSRAAGSKEPRPVSAELWAVMSQSQKISQQSEGLFDVTVGPLSKLWRRARRRKEMPPADAIANALAVVGYQHIELDQQNRTIRLARPGMQIDLGGIAKGYAADEARRVFQARGMPRCLVNAGGDLAIGWPPPAQPGWKVGVAPLEPNGPPSVLLSLSRCGIATSGDAWQFVQLEGKRYSHIINPKTGMPTTHRNSVTVIASNCMSADGYASAVSVLGPQQGPAFVESSPELEGFIVWAADSGVKTYRSSGFPASIPP